MPASTTTAAKPDKPGGTLNRVVRSSLERVADLTAPVGSAPIELLSRLGEGLSGAE
ncbi:hypothetical protein BH09ACT2_BH09ACT2_16200 [soil metagenome]